MTRNSAQNATQCKKLPLSKSVSGRPIFFHWGNSFPFEPNWTQTASSLPSVDSPDGILGLLAIMCITPASDRQHITSSLTANSDNCRPMFRNVFVGLRSVEVRSPVITNVSQQQRINILVKRGRNLVYCWCSNSNNDLCVATCSSRASDARVSRHSGCL